MTEPLRSVVIPAHDKQAVIRSGLDALFEGFADGELDVLVVCNGCTDHTSDVARSSGHPVTVVELQTASKPATLREGDRRATAFPRIYLDADVRMPDTLAWAVLELLRSARRRRPGHRCFRQHRSLGGGPQLLPGSQTAPHRLQGCVSFRDASAEPQVVFSVIEQHQPLAGTLPRSEPSHGR